MDDALGVGDEEAVGRRDLGRGVEEVFEGGAGESEVGGIRDLADVDEGGDEVDGVGEGVDFTVLGESGGGPVDEHGDAVAAIVGGAFFSFHAGVEDLFAGCGSVIGGEDEEGVVCDSEVCEEFAGGADVIIDIGDHAVEGGDFFVLIFVEAGVFFGAMEGAVGCVE